MCLSMKMHECMWPINIVIYMPRRERVALQPSVLAQEKPTILEGCVPHPVGGNVMVAGLFLAYVVGG